MAWSPNKWRAEEKDKLEGDLSKVGTPGLSERQKSQQRAQAMQAAGQQAQVQQSGKPVSKRWSPSRRTGGVPSRANESADCTGS